MRVGEVFLVIGVPVSFRGPSENMRKSPIAKLATRIFLISRPRYHSYEYLCINFMCVCLRALCGALLSDGNGLIDYAEFVAVLFNSAPLPPKVHIPEELKPYMKPPKE